MSTNLLGIILAILGGVLVGNCMLPLKRVRQWPWECTWLIFSLTSLLLIPCLVAFLIVPQWPQLYRLLTLRDILPACLFGFGWGIAQVLFGVSVVRLGMALGFTIVVGLGTVFGTLVPLVALHHSAPGDNAHALILGCSLMVAGVALSGWAGRLREQPQSGQKQNYRSGLIIAILSGVLSSMLNLSFAFSGSIAEAAMRRGAVSSTAVFAVWPLALAAGLIPNLGYAIYLLQKKRTWKFFTTEPFDGVLSFFMGLLWIGAVLIYGLSTRYLGSLGVSAGWAIYQIVMVLTANTAGILTGEWRSTTSRARITLSSGILILILATVITAISTR